ncbi:hypothetical protein F5878DRAFT_618178 [Lentinula raphanica]|uniref:RRM domain-containing protein n=1 Tax=Lentinula raphanica TaxID=153919 RepID=A0AA38UF22_9AGAR|nr:hypothetical protein F5878DRAFT_618178 [Lentinula raphanica]
MADSPLVKRLHISGLTPSLTPADLSARLSHFGTVKSVDGFGLSDGVGQPRKFGYVTIETTSGMLKKCLSSLSGTTYKGAKLRIGEAKPDFTERIAKEKAESSSESSNKQRRLHHSKFSGVQAPDMSLVTRDNAAERPGWKVMPSGRVVRTMKMRPGKPLPPLPTHLMDQSHSKVKKKKVKEPDARARSRLIDVTKWDGSYVSGVFLGGDQVAQVVDGRVGAIQAKKKEQEEKKEKSKGKVKEKKTKSETMSIVIDKEENVPAFPRPSTPQSIPTPAVGAPLPTSSSSSKLPDLSAERAQTLSFLNTFLFSSSKTQSANPIDWDSDVDLDEVNVLEAPNAVGANDADEEYEIVPGEAEHEDQMIVDEDQGHGDSVDSADEDDVAHVSQDVDMRDENTTEAQPPPNKNKNTLQDLFAPREDEGGFSLLNHLDLEDDDDLDLDVVPFPTSAPVVETHQEDVSLHDTNSNQPPTLRSQQNRSSQPITLDPKKPLFFPRSIALATSSAASSPFYAHLTPEEIQKEWEEKKVELTRGWKKRHREAGKVRRRRGVGIEE